MPTTAGLTRRPAELVGAGARPVERYVAPASEPEALWRSLFYFNIYRLTCAITLLLITTTWSGAFPFGSRDYALFVSVSACYAVFSLVPFEDAQYASLPSSSTPIEKSLQRSRPPHDDAPACHARFAQGTNCTIAPSRRTRKWAETLRLAISAK